jgi:hypothetical protein
MDPRVYLGKPGLGGTIAHPCDVALARTSSSDGHRVRPTNSCPPYKKAFSVLGPAQSVFSDCAGLARAPRGIIRLSEQRLDQPTASNARARGGATMRRRSLPSGQVAHTRTEAADTWPWVSLATSSLAGPDQLGLPERIGMSSGGSQLLSITCLASCRSRWGPMS